MGSPWLFPDTLATDLTLLLTDIWVTPSLSSLEVCSTKPVLIHPRTIFLLLDSTTPSFPRLITPVRPEVADTDPRPSIFPALTTTPRTTTSPLPATPTLNPAFSPSLPSVGETTLPPLGSKTPSP